MKTNIRLSMLFGLLFCISTSKSVFHENISTIMFPQDLKLRFDSITDSNNGICIGASVLLIASIPMELSNQI